VAEDNAMPTENLISPEPLRRLCWQQPPADSANYAQFIESGLGELGVRPWQIRLVKPVLEAALGQTTPLIVEEVSESTPEESD
jgi:ribonuclease D